MKLSTWPFYDDEQISSVAKILKSGRVNYWTGDQGKIFEKVFSDKFHAKYSVALANGSLALSCAYLALDLKTDDEIITTPRTFIATSSSAVLLGIKPVFVDVDINSGNINYEKIEPAINKKTKAIVVVHLAGWPAEMQKICELAKNMGFILLKIVLKLTGLKLIIKM